MLDVVRQLDQMQTQLGLACEGVKHLQANRQQAELVRREHVLSLWYTALSKLCLLALIDHGWTTSASVAGQFVVVEFLPVILGRRRS